MTELLIARKPCSQCLTSRNRIVSANRATNLIRECRDGDKHFICHKGSIAGLNLHCRGVHATNGPCAAYRIAKLLDIPIVEVDADALGG